MNNASRFKSIDEAHSIWLKIPEAPDFNTWLFEPRIQGAEDNPSVETPETWATEDPNI